MVITTTAIASKGNSGTAPVELDVVVEDRVVVDEDGAASTVTEPVIQRWIVQWYL